MFDLTSDVHLDFWVTMNSNLNKMEKQVGDFAISLLPENPQKILVIAGDLGHYNLQNAMFLRKMRETYDRILLVPGNHDYYLVSHNMQNKFGHNSINRWRGMLALASGIDGVVYLDGNTATISDTTFGGCGMWYDFSFGIQNFYKSQEEIRQIWWDKMNDRRFIFGASFETSSLYEFEKRKLDRVIAQSDVIVTHVGPDWSKIPLKYQMDVATSFYYFDGSEYFEKIYGKIWCYGHTHDRYDYIKNGCWFLNAALGYPGDRSLGRKIVNIPL